MCSNPVQLFQLTVYETERNLIMALSRWLHPIPVMVLVSIFLFTFHFSVPTTTVAFSPSSCYQTKTKSSFVDKFQEQKLQTNRNPNHLPLLTFPVLKATKIEQDAVFSRRWYPDETLDDAFREDLEGKSLELASELLRQIICSDRGENDAEAEEKSEDDAEDNEDTDEENHEEANQKAYELARGRFLDFCGDRKGEEILESLFLKVGDTKIGKELLAKDDPVVYQQVVEGAIISFQSLLALGITYGLTMNPMGVSKTVAHMKDDAEALDTTGATQNDEWTQDHSLRLKYRALSDNNAEEKVAGLQLVSKVKFKRTPLGAYNLLVRMGAWKKHENLALLRSGFPTRFTADEDAIADHVAAESTSDQIDEPDTLLGIRRDFRSQKIYTIDGASTKEIDDGLGVEVINEEGENSQKRYRYWIHIADAERWAPRNSRLFQVARRRATSIYLPGSSIPMMPSSVSQQVMSLKAQTDVCALSLGVELNDDGSIIEDSIIVTPSTVRVDYRLTYDDADEMLEDGVGYSEEWELGQLFTAAQRRRQFRMDNGSSEDFVPTQIPQYTISTYPDQSEPDGIGINVDIQISHNGGRNQSAVVVDSLVGGSQESTLSNELPVSSSSTLVTEMMIMAGEAIGKWAMRETKAVDDEKKLNSLELPFRSQEKPDYRSREREQKIMMDLLENNIGGGYCHAWYSRRFLTPAKVTPDANPHSGLGLACYVQWTSPIRRFQDLQVHATVKRFLRRQKVVELLKNGQEVPTGITAADLGCEVPTLNEDGSINLNLEDIDKDIDYSERTKLLRPATFVMRNSNKFWMLEYIRRIKESDPQRTLEVLVLGCINPQKRQYAVFIYDLGLEWRYSSPVGIQAGDRFKARLGNVLPQNGQMTLIRVSSGTI